MSVLRYHITHESKRLPYYNTPQIIHEQDGLEYRVIHEDNYPEGFYYHLESRQIRHPMEGFNNVAWRVDVDNLEDHISSCHFILEINRIFNTEFVCADADWECTDRTIPCEERT